MLRKQDIKFPGKINELHNVQNENKNLDDQNKNKNLDESLKKIYKEVNWGLKNAETTGYKDQSATFFNDDWKKPKLRLDIQKEVIPSLTRYMICCRIKGPKAIAKYREPTWEWKVNSISEVSFENFKKLLEEGL